MGLAERVVEQATAFCRRLGCKLHPPSVRDRMRVDRRRGRVTLDGSEFDVTDNQSILFHYLVDANGQPVSGCEIAKKEKLQEFKAGRHVQRIKHDALKRIIKKEEKANGRFYIRLPPLADPDGAAPR
jgi:hypothetical protein